MNKHTIKYAANCFLPLMIFLLLTGCKFAPTENQPAETTREIKDDLGRTIKLPSKIDRAVSLAPNLTEIVFAVDAGDRLVGDTTFCDYPEAAQKIRKVGDTLNPNVETIIALKPQVVFVSTASQMETLTKNLEAQNIPVFITNPKDLRGIYASILQIGDILGKSEKASQVVGEMKRRVAEIEVRTQTKNQVKTFVQIAREPLFTIGRDSFITDLITEAGGVSVTANVPEAYPKFSKESAVALEPEAIVLSESPDNFAPNEVFKNSSAVKNGKVFKIKSDLLSRPGPRVVDGLEQLAKDLRPESFQ